MSVLTPSVTTDSIGTFAWCQLAKGQQSSSLQGFARSGETESLGPCRLIAFDKESVWSVLIETDLFQIWRAAFNLSKAFPRRRRSGIDS